MMKRIIRTVVAGVLLGCGFLAAEIVFDRVTESDLIIESALARVGRPMTPVSVAGVARRTTRRAIRRSTIYAATLPRGCATVVVEGTNLYHCGTTYYQADGKQYVVVYVD